MVINISHKRGDTYKGASYTIGLSGGSPLDLTDASIKYHLKKEKGDILPVFEFTDITITEPLSGMFTVEPAIIDITARDYFYDIEIITADSFVRTPIEGTFTITADVSR